jgi:hypothetical protein
LTERRRLRDFGLLVGAVLLCWGGLRLWRGRSYGAGMMAAGAALALLGLALPGVLRLPFRVWMALGHVLGALNTRLLLSLTFWLMVVPLGLLRRLFSGSALAAKRRDLPGGGKSYWTETPRDERGPKHFDNMF